MAIAVLPEDPQDRWERLGWTLVAIAAGIVIALFVYSMLDAYVF